MPIYEFQCQKCGNIFESLCVRSDDEANAACPSCGGQKTKRLLSRFSSHSQNTNKELGSSMNQASCSSTGGFS